MPEYTELWKELGPENRIDQVAARGYILGIQQQDPQLLNLSHELVVLSTSIPYDNDQFDIKVNPKFREVEQRIREVEELPTRFQVHDSYWNDEGWNLQLQEHTQGNNNGQFEIRIATSIIEPIGIMERSPMTLQVLQFLHNKLLPGKSTSLTLNGSGDSHSNSNYSTDNLGRETYQQTWYVHDSGDREFIINSYFYNPERAREIWKHVDEMIGNKHYPHTEPVKLNKPDPFYNPYIFGNQKYWEFYREQLFNLIHSLRVKMGKKR